jgi:hypothetical protein
MSAPIGNCQGAPAFGREGFTMRPNMLAIVIVTSFLGTEGLAADLRWTNYEDADFNCVLDYPAGLFSPEAVPPGKPRLFSSPDGDVYFRIQGMENADGWTPETIREKYVSANIPGDLTYDRTRSYPRVQKEAFDRIVTRMSRSLRSLN